MNPNYLPNENHERHRERLHREMDEEAVEHKKAIAAALRKAGHSVVMPTLDNLMADYFGYLWSVNGQDIEVSSRKEVKGYTSTPTGGLRIVVGSYNHKKTFKKRSSAKELKNFPEGFDYGTIAQTMVDLIAQRQQTENQQAAATKRAQENDAVAAVAAKHLMSEFGLKPPFPGLIPRPLVLQRGHAELGLEFGYLNEEQARAILRAARDCGAVKSDDEEV